MRVLSHSEVFSVLGWISEDPEEEGYVHIFDAIEYERRIWLVPSWLEAQDGTHRLPERIVGLPHQSAQETGPGSAERYTLRAPVPKSVLDGTVSPRSAYIVVELPDIRVQIALH